MKELRSYSDEKKIITERKNRVWRNQKEKKKCAIMPLTRLVL